MAIWLIRAGSHGEYEQKFIQENRVYVTWGDLDVNLAKLPQRADLTAAMNNRYADGDDTRQRLEGGKPVDDHTARYAHRRRCGRQRELGRTGATSPRVDGARMDFKSDCDESFHLENDYCFTLPINGL